MPNSNLTGPRLALALATTLTLLALPAVSAQTASPFAGTLDYTTCGAGVLHECGEEGDTQCNYGLHVDISIDERKFEVGIKRECRNTGFSKRYKDRPHLEDHSAPSGPSNPATGCGSLGDLANRFPGTPCKDARQP